MVPLGRFVKGVFGVQALALTLLLLLQPYLLWRILHLPAEDSDRFRSALLGFAIIVFVVATLTAIFGMAWWSLRRGDPGGRRWAIAASVLNLPLFGVGTMVGIAGLLVFTRKETVAQLTHGVPESQP